MKLGEILIAAYAYELYMWKTFRFLTELPNIIYNYSVSPTAYKTGRDGLISSG